MKSYEDWGFVVGGCARDDCTGRRPQRGGQTASTTTLVFGTEADPALLDPALVSDGPSLRADRPDLREPRRLQARERQRSCRSSRRAGSRARTARRGRSAPQGREVPDGTQFNAAAVCSNFNRWYNFPAPLQSDALSYYWNTVFGGFENPAPGTRARTRASTRAARRTGNYSVDAPPDAPLVVVPRRARAAELRHREPDGAEEVPGRRRHGRRERRLPSDGHVRDAASDRHRPVHAQVVDVGDKLELVARTRSTGARRRSSSASSSGRSATTRRGCRRSRPARSRAIDLRRSRRTSARSSGNSEPEAAQPPAVQRRLRRHQPGDPADEQPPGPAGGRLRARPSRRSSKAFYAGRGARRRTSSCRRRSSASRTRACRLPVQPGQGEAAAAAGRADAAGEDRLLVPDERLAAVHAGPGSGTSRRSQASLEKSGFKVSPHSAPWRPDYLARVQAGKARCTCSAGRATSVTRRTS